MQGSQAMHDKYWMLEVKGDEDGDGDDVRCCSDEVVMLRRLLDVAAGCCEFLAVALRITCVEIAVSNLLLDPQGSTPLLHSGPLFRET